MTKHFLTFLIIWSFALLHAEAQVRLTSALNPSEFGKHWLVESESPGYSVRFQADTLELVAPKGLTLWRKEKMKGEVDIEYDAMIVVRDSADRLSDLNCFWMATDPLYPDDIMRRAKWRGGVFKNCYSLRQYYLGYGGNYNSTTRFRRYPGDEVRNGKVTAHNDSPAILREYTDEDHLLKPNHWYHIRIHNEGNRVQYNIDGKCIVDFRDPDPLTEGWFGFRTTLSHVKLTNFRCCFGEKYDDGIPLHWVGCMPKADKNVSFGVPFRQGEVKDATTLALVAGNGTTLPSDRWPLAYWPDGSLKWVGMAAIVPVGSQNLKVALRTKKTGKSDRAGGSSISIRETTERIFVSTESLEACIPKSGNVLLDSLKKDGIVVGENLRLVCSTVSPLSDDVANDITRRQYISKITEAKVENCGKLRACIRIEGLMVNGQWSTANGQCSTANGQCSTFNVQCSMFNGQCSMFNGQCSTANAQCSTANVQCSTVNVQCSTVNGQCSTANGQCSMFNGQCSTVNEEWLPFVVRLYFYAGSDEMRMVHSFVFDGDENRDFISSLGVRMDVPLQAERYNRHVAFSADGGVWSEPVQPLVGRRRLNPVKSSQPITPFASPNYENLQLQGMTIPAYSEFDSLSRSLLDSWASWDGYRLSQYTPDGFTIRKRANDHRPWIGTEGGHRADGCAFLGTTEKGVALWMKDFWQAYPSEIAIDGATTKARLTAWLWSPDANPMDLRHYDDVAHGLNASYEDVQEGLSTPYGIARTSELVFKMTNGYRGKKDFASLASSMKETSVLMPESQYLHDVRAFGVWSMPDTTSEFCRKVERKIKEMSEYYLKAVDQHRWYGFWNYGDVMHEYDPERHSWKYDVGGFAWDNTELASNMMLWYNFLRTSDVRLWTMAEAMTRHTAEVDVYHKGDYAGLGTRHNVSHWGCGAKEARISQAIWNRFYYYLTTDERTGELMTEVKDADQRLYTLDPMRLAQPRSLYPCTAPARLRIGPDWLAYAGNWMTEWERKRDNHYRDKILAGMNSIAALPHGIFSGPKALGYDPATGIITCECDTGMQNTNHLLAIMGGFEMMNELIPMMDNKAWNKVWLDHAANYRNKALQISGNRFRVARLSAYAAYMERDHAKALQAWDELVNASRRSRRTELDVVNRKTDQPDTLHPIDEIEGLSTNYAATWTLDAIYMLEVLPTE